MLYRAGALLEQPVFCFCFFVRSLLQTGCGDLMSTIGGPIHEEFAFNLAGLQVIFFKPHQHSFYIDRCPSSSAPVMIMLSMMHSVLGISANIWYTVRCHIAEHDTVLNGKRFCWYRPLCTFRVKYHLDDSTISIYRYVCRKSSFLNYLPPGNFANMSNFWQRLLVYSQTWVHSDFIVSVNPDCS